ncbi:MAG: DUF1844 domain-containing protein [Candidatus Zixiibacteriota bacterium]
MNETMGKIDPYFMQLILSLQTGAMHMMGKVVSPVTGKIERDLVQVSNTIEMLSMLETKMKGNMTEEEDKILKHVLYELRLNYVEESKKDETEPDDKEQKEESAETPEPEKEQEK